MRIAHLILSSRFAGSERHALELAALQAAAGHDVRLVMRRKAARDSPDAIAHRVDPAVGVELVDDWLFRWPARRQATAFVRGWRPDVAHAHLGSACRSLHPLAGHCLRVATLHIEYKPRQHAALDGLVAIAPWQLDAIPAALRANSVQIDNWTRPSAPTPDARARLRAAHGIAPDAFVFGALGRVEDSKGLDVLVEAFRRADLPGARLVIVGAGKAFDRIRAQAGEAVVMPGFTTRARDWMEVFDVFVSAARYEPFGLVFLEAMSAGLPVIASASQGGRYLAPVFGREPVPVDDPDALAAALREAFQRREPRRTYPMARFDPQARAADVEAFYRQGLARLGRYNAA